MQKDDECFAKQSHFNALSKLDFVCELRYLCDLTRLRNIVIAPLVEEIIFRGCILFHLQRRFDSCGALCLGSGLLFSICEF